MARHGRVLLGAGVAVVAFAVALAWTARPNLTALFTGGASEPQCRAAAAIAEAVAPFATGEMVAFTPVEPADLTALPYDGGGEDPARLGALTGRTVLLNLWATWCAPCRAEMPSLAALHAAEAGEDFAVVAVSIDNRDANRPEEFLAETGAEALDYHREPTLTLFNSLKAAGLAPGMPTTLLIGPDGCVAGRVAGAAEWDGEDARRLIRAARDAV